VCQTDGRADGRTGNSIQHALSHMLSRTKKDRSLVRSKHYNIKTPKLRQCRFPRHTIVISVTAVLYVRLSYALINNCCDIVLLCCTRRHNSQHVGLYFAAFRVTQRTNIYGRESQVYYQNKQLSYSNVDFAVTWIWNDPVSEMFMPSFLRVDFRFG